MLKVSLMKRTKSLTYQPNLRAQRVRKKKKVLMKAMMRERKIYQQVENASISCARPKRFTKKYDLELKRTSIVSFARIATKTTKIIFTVSSVSRSTQIIAKIKMTISGLAVTTVNAG